MGQNIIQNKAPYYLTDDDTFAIFSNEERIISYSFHKGNIEMMLCDFSIEVMDKIITDYLNISNDTVCQSKFNISFSGDEYLSLFAPDQTIDTISKKSGLKVEDVALIQQLLTREDNTSFILQDIIDEIGCLGVLMKFDTGYLLFKHIVPNKNLNRQRVVFAKGDAQDIIDSIYIL